MYFTTLLAFATAALAAPARFMSQAAEEWTIESLSRTCTDELDQCVWTFTVNTYAEDVEPTEVRYVINGTDDTPATRAIGGPSEYGVFTVTSNWSDYFGEDEAWTTLSVIDYERGVLVYPAYTDVQVEEGEVVEPDQTYVPEALP